MEDFVIHVTIAGDREADAYQFVVDAIEQFVLTTEDTAPEGIRISTPDGRLTEEL